MVDDSKLTTNDKDSENTVSVYNLPSIYDESDVQSLFANIGTVVECTLKHEDEKLINIATVKFSSQKEAEDAVVLSGVSVRYHILKITRGLPQIVAKNESKEDGDDHDKSRGEMNSSAKLGEMADRMASKRSEVGKSTTSKPSDPPESQIDKDKPFNDEVRNDVKRDRGEKRGYIIDSYSSISSSGSSRGMTRHRRIRSISRERNRRNRPRRGYRQSRSSSRDRYRRRDSRYDRDRIRYNRRRYSRSYSRSSSHYSVSDVHSRGSYSTDSRDSYKDNHRRNRRGRHRDRSRSRSSSSKYGGRHRNLR